MTNLSLTGESYKGGVKYLKKCFRLIFFNPVSKINLKNFCLIPWIFFEKKKNPQKPIKFCGENQC
jgi:hypothetical protein